MRVRLLERTAEAKDKICGEFLSVEAQHHLQALGLDLAHLGGAPISTLRLAQGERRIEALLPFVALGLTRKALDEALLRHAAASGARVERGVVARAWEEGRLQTSAGELAPSALLLATGKHELRGAQRSRTSASDYIGFKMYFRPTKTARAALEGAIEVTLFDGGYAGLQLVEGGVANLCLVISGPRFAALGKTWEALLAALLCEPLLRDRLADAEPLLPHPLTIAGVPYGFLHRPAPGDDPRLYRLGDQSAVIPSFTGDGMSIALHSGRLAARALIAGGEASAYQARLYNDIQRPVRLATRLQRIGENMMGRHAILSTVRLWPAVLTDLARATRISPAALRDAGLSASA